MYLVGMEVMVDVPQYTFAALLWLGRGIVLCVAGLLRIRGIVIGIGILRANHLPDPVYRDRTAPSGWSAAIEAGMNLKVF